MPRFDDRMSDAEALMWRVEKDPFLTSTFANITVLDRPIDFEAFVAAQTRFAAVADRVVSLAHRSTAPGREVAP